MTGLWDISLTHYQFRRCTSSSFMLLDFQRKHLGRQSKNNPVSLQHFVKGWQMWPLHSITTNSIMQLLCYNSLAYFQRLKLLYWEITFVLKRLLQILPIAPCWYCRCRVYRDISETASFQGKGNACHTHLLRDEDKQKIKEVKKRLFGFFFFLKYCVTGLSAKILIAFVGLTHSMHFVNCQVGSH